MSDRAEPMAKVVYVLSDFEVVINKGAIHGIRNGSAVKIYGLGDMMTDPETKEELEQVEIVRGFGRVTNVQEKIATVRSSGTLPPVKVVSRQSAGILGAGAISNFFPSTIEESTREREAPFDSPQIGDHARVFLKS